MKSLREIDALVAEHIMTDPKKVMVQLVEQVDQASGTVTFKTVMEWPRYSTSIEAAWDVVEKLSQENFLVQTRTFMNQPWQSQCLILKSPETADWIVETGEQMPHAICKAALKAKGIEA